MIELTYEKLDAVKGGATINGTIINALVRGINSLLELGRSLGTAIRRTKDGGICPV